MLSQVCACKENYMFRVLHGWILNINMSWQFLRPERKCRRRRLYRWDGSGNWTLDLGGALMCLRPGTRLRLYVLEVSKINDRIDVLLLVRKYLHSRKHSSQTACLLPRSYWWCTYHACQATNFYECKRWVCKYNDSKETLNSIGFCFISFFLTHRVI